MQLSRRVLGFVIGIGLATAGVAGCGPSAGQVQQARSAHYRTDKTVVFQAVVDAVADKLKVGHADVGVGALTTEPRWYEADGTYLAKAGNSNNSMAQDGAIRLGYDVKVVASGDGFIVEVIPRAEQFRTGYSAPFPLAITDPSMPGWVHGITDDLYMEINARLKPYAVAGGDVVPASATPVSAAPPAEQPAAPGAEMPPAATPQ